MRSAARASEVELRGPAKAPIERVRGNWRYMILLLAKDPRALGRTCLAARAARIPRRVNLAIDIDPSAVL
jgi:primosomal protein N'